jgi:hypothetical protein
MEFREFIEKREYQAFVNQVLANLGSAFEEYKGWGMKPGDNAMLGRILTRNFPGLRRKSGNEFILEREGFTLKFNLARKGAEQQRPYDGSEAIMIGLKPVVDARTPEELDRVLQNLDGTLRHETTHLTHRGKPEPLPGQATYSGGDPNTAEMAEKLINNFLGDGELRAYATEYAYYYSQQYPDKPFEPRKMVAIGAKLGGNKQNKLDMFFNKFLDPEIQAKYEPYLRPYGLSLKKGHDTLVQYIQQELASGRPYSY